MKKFDTKKQQKLVQIQKDHQAGQQQIYLATAKHRQMKRIFKGIMSYDQRKILYKIGVRNAHRDADINRS